MIAGLIPLAIAAIGCAYAGIVLRAAPTRRDNLIFGALALTDAAMTAWRGLTVLSGNSIADPAVTVPCALGTIVLAAVTFEFLSSFPRGRAMRWRWRIVLWVWTLAGAATLIFVDRGTADHSRALSQAVFYGPATLFIVIQAAFAWRRSKGSDARTVIAMLAFRWLFGFFAYFIGPRFGLLESLMWAETTFATTLGFIVIGTSVLRTELFSIRSSSAEAITVATIAFGVALGGGGTVLAVLRYTEAGTIQVALLVGATFVPLALAAIGRALYPRLEKNVLAPLDDRRARRLGVQGEPLPAGQTTAIEEAIARITQIADGAVVTWQPASQLSQPLADLLRNGEPQRQDKTPDLPACFIVPALGADRALVGAFFITNGLIDRDTYLVARDLAARVALVIERAQAVSELEDARRLAALGQFAAAIAHDIRTPLTSISLNIQILQRKLQLSPDDKEHLDIAIEELARLDKSVAEILDFAKPVKLAPQEIDVGELLETTTRGLSPVLSEKGVSIKVEPASELTVHGDPQRLRQVLVNLVGNAADASQPGAAVTLRAKPTDDRQIAIEVEDHGRGIGADDLPRIFEPFFTTRPDGTGLGLAICHKVIRAHGGDIQVRSTPGLGSTFTVVLPAL